MVSNYSSIFALRNKVMKGYKKACQNGLSFSSKCTFYRKAQNTIQ